MRHRGHVPSDTCESRISWPAALPVVGRKLSFQGPHTLSYDHLFGATSSPSCANFALKKTADDYEEEFGAQAANFIRHNFYVDDGLKSVPTVEEALNLVKNVKQMCSKGGFNLYRFLSNSKEVKTYILTPYRWNTPLEFIHWKNWKFTYYVNNM